MSSNMSTSKVNPITIKVVKQKIDLNDPIQARLYENKLTLKKSNLWVRRNKIQPVLETGSPTSK